MQIQPLIPPYGLNENVRNCNTKEALARKNETTPNSGANAAVIIKMPARRNLLLKPKPHQTNDFIHGLMTELLTIEA